VIYSQIPCWAEKQPIRILQIPLDAQRRGEERRRGLGGGERSPYHKGRLFLRKTRIDELPQLFNVLIGELDFVGRGRSAEFAAKTSDTDPYYDLRHTVKPGITGWRTVCSIGSTIDESKKNSSMTFSTSRHVAKLDLLILFHPSRSSSWGAGRDREDRFRLRPYIPRIQRVLLIIDGTSTSRLLRHFTIFRSAFSNLCRPTERRMRLLTFRFCCSRKDRGSGCFQRIQEETKKGEQRIGDDIPEAIGYSATEKGNPFGAKNGWAYMYLSLSRHIVTRNGWSSGIGDRFRDPGRPPVGRDRCGRGGGDALP